MVYGGGLQREHDRMEREAAAERAYDHFETVYIYNNMRPESIGLWEWRLMFDRLLSHENKAAAMQDARDMAIEIGRAVIVEERYSGCYRAIPDDYWERVNHFPNRYQLDKYNLIKKLAVSDKYPDLPRIAMETNHNSSHLISYHHFQEIKDKHKKWKEEYTTLDDWQKNAFFDKPF